MNPPLSVSLSAGYGTFFRQMRERVSESQLSTDAAPQKFPISQLLICSRQTSRRAHRREPDDDQNNCNQKHNCEDDVGEESEHEEGNSRRNRHYPAVFRRPIGKPCGKAGGDHDGEPEQGLREEGRVVLTEDTCEIDERDHDTEGSSGAQWDSPPSVAFLRRAPSAIVRQWSSRGSALWHVDANPIVD